MKKISEYIRSSASGNYFLLAGPCVIEGEEMALDIAGTLLEETSRLDIPYIFKGSYRKVCQYQERTVFITGINGFRVRQGFGFGKQRIRRDRTWHIFRIRRPRGRHAEHSGNEISVRMSGDNGHNPFAPATEQCEWRHRRTPGTDFHHRTLSHRCRSGRYIHGDAPQSGRGEERRSEHAAAQRGPGIA